jgi:hypothetical protein
LNEYHRYEGAEIKVSLFDVAEKSKKGMMAVLWVEEPQLIGRALEGWKATEKAKCHALSTREPSRPQLTG